MNPTTQSLTNSVYPARQQRILRLPEVKAKTGFGRSTILKQQSRRHYGSLALSWLRYLTQHSAQVRPVFQNVRRRFLASLPPEADGQVRQRAGWLDRSGASLPSRHTVHPEHNTTGSQTLYLFYPTGWREATEGLSPDRAAKALMAAGYLVPDGNRPQRKVSLPDNTRPRTSLKINRVLKAAFWMTNGAMNPVWACRLAVNRQSTQGLDEV